MADTWFVDVSVSRIQGYVSRAPHLAGRRGASHMIKEATDPKPIVDEWRGGASLRPNDAAGAADGKIRLRLDGATEEMAREVATMAIARMRSLLPAGELEAVWGTGATYTEAYLDFAARREVGHVLVSLPTLLDYPPSASCGFCEISPPVAWVNQPGDSDRKRACRDCAIRYGTGRGEAREHEWLIEALGDAEVETSEFAKDFDKLAGLESADEETHQQRTAVANHLATLYFDGNSFGEFFARLAEAGEDVDRDSVSRQFNEAPRDALVAATRAIAKPHDTVPPVVVHVLGGDDVVASVPARRAWAFALKYLECYRDRLQEIVNTEMPKMEAESPVASAGLCIAHTRFPFRRSLELSEQALTIAKRHFARLTSQPRQPTLMWHDVTSDGEQSADRTPVSLGELAEGGELRELVDSFLDLDASFRDSAVALSRLSEPRAGRELRELFRRHDKEELLKSIQEVEETGHGIADIASIGRWWRVS